MKLAIRIEDQQAGTLHSSALRALTLAAAMPDLDRAVEVLKAHLTADQWEIGRGGHHAFVLWKQYGQFLRVAMVVECPVTIKHSHKAGAGSRYIVKAHRVWSDLKNTRSYEAIYQATVTDGKVTDLHKVKPVSSLSGGFNTEYKSISLKSVKGIEIAQQIADAFATLTDEQRNRMEVA